METVYFHYVFHTNGLNIWNFGIHRHTFWLPRERVMSLFQAFALSSYWKKKAKAGLLERSLAIPVWEWPVIDCCSDNGKLHRWNLRTKGQNVNGKRIYVETYRSFSGIYIDVGRTSELRSSRYWRWWSSGLPAGVMDRQNIEWTRSSTSCFLSWMFQCSNVSSKESLPNEIFSQETWPLTKLFESLFQLQRRQCFCFPKNGDNL